MASGGDSSASGGAFAGLRNLLAPEPQTAPTLPAIGGRLEALEASAAALGEPGLAYRIAAARLEAAVRMGTAPRRPEAAPADGFSRSAYGPYLAATPGDRTWELSVKGYYGDFIAGIIRSQAGPYEFWDIGANAGVFSLVAAARDACVRAIAVEPVPATFALLVANLARNAADKVIPFCAAFAEPGTGIACLSYNPSHSGMARLAPMRGWSRVYAPVLRAADVAAFPTDPSLPILLKIDVEGAELHVLRTLAATPHLARVRQVVIEFVDSHQSEAERDAILALLAAHGLAERRREGRPEQYDALFERDAGEAPTG
jgi:FkbM family methyltransferase